MVILTPNPLSQWERGVNPEFFGFIPLSF